MTHLKNIKESTTIRFTMRKKLIIGITIILSIILVLLAGSRIIVKNFKYSSEKLITEYHELHVLQEYKLSLSKILSLVSTYNYDQKEISSEDVQEAMENSKNKLEKCKQTLTEFHKGKLWVDLEIMTDSMSSSVNKLFQPDKNEAQIVNKLILETINLSIKKVDALVNQTIEEITVYEKRSQTAIRHGSILIITFGIILILLLLFGSMRFMQNLTRPITELLVATQRISSGDRTSKVQVNFGDEFQVLADSFNNMLDILNKTTISEEYHRSIVNNLFGALAVTDKHCKIRSVNKSFTDLFGYAEDEILNKTITVLFKEDLVNYDFENIQNMETFANLLREKRHVIKKDGTLIHVLNTCKILKNKKNENEGLVFVVHDLTEDVNRAQELESIRKQQIIAINEAQEEERMRIAIDIHDGLGQMLSAISYSIQEANETGNGNICPRDKVLKQIDLAIQEAKNLAHNLIPILLKDFGLVAALQNMFDKANNLYETNFIFNAYDFTERIDPKLEKAIFRICQESLNNIVKHARADKATFELFKTIELITLVVEDDGVGFNIKDSGGNEKKSGIGLISIRERATGFGGTFTIHSEINKGTELIIEIPCHKI